MLRGGPQGVGFTGIDFQSASPREINVRKDQTTGLQFGFDFEYFFTERFGIATGLIFSRQGQTYSLEFDNTWGSRTLDIRLMYAQIPFALLYRLIQTSKTNVYLRAGFYAGYRTDADDNYQAVIPEEILLPVPEERYSPGDFGCLAGMGAEISLSKMLNLRISIEAARGLRNVFRDEPWGYLAGAASAKNTIVALSIGLVYLHGSCCDGN
ncbi:MAG: PorT family protein [Desulfobacteraceae bacterium]|nr:PorT family protein [Desulfobacteraceae bacterium]